MASYFGWGIEMSRLHRRFGLAAALCLIVSGALPKTGELLVSDTYSWVKRQLTHDNDGAAGQQTAWYDIGSGYVPEYKDTVVPAYVDTYKEYFTPAKRQGPRKVH
jgi:hypothetical protein